MNRRWSSNLLVPLLSWNIFFYPTILRRLSVLLLDDFIHDLAISSFISYIFIRALFNSPYYQWNIKTLSWFKREIY